MRERARRAARCALGRAVHDAFDKLSSDAQRILGDVEPVVAALLRDAERIREAELGLQQRERLARRVEDDAERGALLAHLAIERGAVRARLATTVSALETLRLELLRAEQDARSVSGVTTHVEAVRHIARRVDAARELGAYLATSNPTPA